MTMDTRSRAEELQRRDQVNRLLAEVTLLRIRGESQKALERCREALAVDPTSAFALEARGDVLSDLGEHSSALDSYRQALRLSPGRGELEEKVGLGVLRLSDTQEFSDIQQQMAAAAQLQREKKKTVSAAVVWSVFVPGGGYFYLGDHPRGAIVFLVFLGLGLYLVASLIEAVAHSTSLVSVLFGGLWIGLRGASLAARVGFSLASAVLVAVYLFNILDTLRRARGILLTPGGPQTAL